MAAKKNKKKAAKTKRKATKKPVGGKSPKGKGLRKEERPEDLVVRTYASLACSRQYDLLRSAVLLAIGEIDKGTREGAKSAGRVLRKAVGE